MIQVPTKNRTFVFLLYAVIAGGVLPAIFYFSRLDITTVIPVVDEIWNEQVASFSHRLPVEHPSRSTKICQKFNVSSIAVLWDRLHETILNHSLPEHDFHQTRTYGLRSNSNFTNWVRRSKEFYTLDRLKRSVLFPLAMDPVMEILERKLSNASAPPLKVMIFGGSTTAGHGCHTNPFMLLGPNKNSGLKDCAWGKRLNDLLDAVLGEGLVEIRNMAIGGANSDVSAVLLEYGIWPEGYVDTGPDLILWAHGVNDGVLWNELKIMHGLRKFQRAATMHRCHEKLPVVVYVDDFLGESSAFGVNMEEQLFVSKSIYQIASWHHAMAVSYPNVVRHYVLSNLESPDQYYDSFGSRGLQRHPGLMHHISVAWVVLFNLLSSIVDTCQRGFPQIDTNQEEYERPAKDIPALKSAMKVNHVAETWANHSHARRERCSNATEAGPCIYRWMSIRVTGIVSREALASQIQPFLVHNHGWQAAGYPIRSPKLGWDAQEVGASFGIKIPVTSTESVQQFSVVVMESYGKTWANAMVEVTPRVLKDDNSTVGANNTAYNISGRWGNKYS